MQTQTTYEKGNELKPLNTGVADNKETPQRKVNFSHFILFIFGALLIGRFIILPELADQVRKSSWLYKTGWLVTTNVSVASGIKNGYLRSKYSILSTNPIKGQGMVIWLCPVVIGKIGQPADKQDKINIEFIDKPGKGFFNYKVNDCEHLVSLSIAQEMYEAIKTSGKTDDKFSLVEEKTKGKSGIEGIEMAKWLEYSLNETEDVNVAGDIAEAYNECQNCYGNRHFDLKEVKQQLSIILQKQNRLNLIAKLYGLIDGFLILTGILIFPLGIRKIKQRKLLKHAK